MAAIVYSVGYTGFPFDALAAFVRQRPQLVLVDVRLQPFSRFHPHWNRPRLQQAFGAQYEWIGELGNLNYKGGDIALKDRDAGMARLRQLLASHDVALMCACRDARTCHRSTITAQLANEGWTIEPVTAAAAQGPRLLD